MVARMILFVSLVVVLTGCATNIRKQATQSQPASYEPSRESYQQETYSQDYNDTWSSDTREKSSKKAYSGPTVQLSEKQIQRALKNAGFYQGAIDGKIGPKTKEAIKRFQKAQGLKPDGIVGKKTSAELNKYLKK